jgi:hypothetical protein
MHPGRPGPTVPRLSGISGAAAAFKCLHAVPRCHGVAAAATRMCKRLAESPPRHDSPYFSVVQPASKQRNPV